MRDTNGTCVCTQSLQPYMANQDETNTFSLASVYIVFAIGLSAHLNVRNHFAAFSSQLWAGNANGEIVIFNTAETKPNGTIRAHRGPVTAIFELEKR